MDNERIDDLQLNGLQIIQNINEFCFGIDAVLLSDFASEIKPKSNVIDLCTGTGIVATLLCEKTKLNKIIGVEILENMCEMAKRSIKLNKLEGKLSIINEDVKNIDKILDNNFYDAITVNPPYKKVNTGIVNESENMAIAKHEVKCNLNDIIKVSEKLLKKGGSFYMVHRPDRLSDIICELREYKLEPKVIKFVYSNDNSNAKLILIKATKGGKTFLKIENPIYMNK